MSRVEWISLISENLMAMGKMSRVAGAPANEAGRLEC